MTHCEVFQMNSVLDDLDAGALTKAQLAETLFEQVGLNKRDAKDAVEVFFDLI